MNSLIAALAGLMAATVVVGVLIRWLGVLYGHVFLQPPEMRRLSVLAPLLVLHSGPWALALIVFAVVKLSAAPMTDVRAWFLGGAAVGVGWMLLMVITSLMKPELPSGRTHAPKGTDPS